jgi:hypothetical protein
MYTGFLWGNLKNRDYLQHPGVYKRIILKYFLKIWNWRAWTGIIWLRIRRDGGLFRIQY